MRCSYCSREIEKGTGLMYVRKIGTVRYYCSDRCYKFEVVQRRKQKDKEIKEATKRSK